MRLKSEKEPFLDQKTALLYGLLCKIKAMVVLQAEKSSDPNTRFPLDALAHILTKVIDHFPHFFNVASQNGQETIFESLLYGRGTLLESAPNGRRIIFESAFIGSHLVDASVRIPPVKMTAEGIEQFYREEVPHYILRKNRFFSHNGTRYTIQKAQLNVHSDSEPLNAEVIDISLAPGQSLTIDAIIQHQQKENRFEDEDKRFELSSKKYNQAVFLNNNELYHYDFTKRTVHLIPNYADDLSKIGRERHTSQLQLKKTIRRQYRRVAGDLDRIQLHDLINTSLDYETRPICLELVFELLTKLVDLLRRNHNDYQHASMRSDLAFRYLLLLIVLDMVALYVIGDRNSYVTSALKVMLIFGGIEFFAQMVKTCKYLIQLNKNQKICADINPKTGSTEEIYFARRYPNETRERQIQMPWGVFFKENEKILETVFKKTTGMILQKKFV